MAWKVQKVLPMHCAGGGGEGAGAGALTSRAVVHGDGHGQVGVAVLRLDLHRVHGRHAAHAALELRREVLANGACGGFRV